MSTTVAGPNTTFVSGPLPESFIGTTLNVEGVNALTLSKNRDVPYSLSITVWPLSRSL
jgi:hypothetical protein